MKPICRHLLSLGVVSLSACFSASFPLTVSTNKPLTPKPPGCEFMVVGSMPQGNYEEIATVRSAGKGCDDPEEFREAVRADVCKVGGDLVVTEVNGYGDFVRGTVLRKAQ